MTLETIHLNACPPEDREILQLWRTLHDLAQAGRRPEFGSLTTETIEKYFALRAGFDMNLRSFMERFAEDFDGIALARAFPKDKLDVLRQLFLQRSKIFNFADAMKRPVATAAHDLTLATLGRILNALLRPAEARAADTWSGL